ncbi:MAG: PH domain-containing protein [Jatrophihabitans sp.]
MPDLLPSEQGKPRNETRQHAIMLLLKKPARRYVILVVVLLVCALLGPWWLKVLFFATLVGLAFVRFRMWQAERIILTEKRIIHVHGILETTRTEASLRLDRISGLRLIETFPGRMLGYATIAVEAPGDHPGLKHLYRMARLQPFYDSLRAQVFGESLGGDPDEGPPEYITEELPVLDKDRDRYGRRRW